MKWVRFAMVVGGMLISCVASARADLDACLSGAAGRVAQRRECLATATADERGRVYYDCELAIVLLESGWSSTGRAAERDCYAAYARWSYLPDASYRTRLNALLGRSATAVAYTLTGSGTASGGIGSGTGVPSTGSPRLVGSGTLMCRDEGCNRALDALNELLLDPAGADAATRESLTYFSRMDQSVCSDASLCAQLAELGTRASASDPTALRTLDVDEFAPSHPLPEPPSSGVVVATDVAALRTAVEDEHLTRPERRDLTDDVDRLESASACLTPAGCRSLGRAVRDLRGGRVTPHVDAVLDPE